VSVDEKEIQAVADILTEWNPLGNNAEFVTDLNGYRTEAIDIIVALTTERKKKPELLVRDVINEAFELSLSGKECRRAAEKIVGVIQNE
jgi:hypothetical protein